LDNVSILPYPSKNTDLGVLLIHIWQDAQHLTEDTVHQAQLQTVRLVVGVLEDMDIIVTMIVIDRIRLKLLTHHPVIQPDLIIQNHDGLKLVQY
jgi:hypothetical protein